MNKKTFGYSFKQSLPVMAGYIVLGFGMGVLLADAGYSFWWAVLMCLTIYAGSMQYVGVELLASGASLVATAIMTLMVQARHLFYGISMVDKYKNTGKLKPYLAFALTDETYSLVCEAEVPEGVNINGYYFFLSILNQSYWLVGCTLGAIFGNTFTFNSAGIDFSMTSLFVVIFVEQWEGSKNHIPALIGLAVSVVCLLIFGAENFLIPAMVGITVGLFALKKPIAMMDEKIKENEND